MGRTYGPQPAFTPPRNQFAELPRIAAESTGLPSLARAHSLYTNGIPGDEQEANEQAIWGALGVSGLVGVAPALRSPRTMPRAAPRAPYQPRDASGTTVATEQYPFGFARDERGPQPGLKTDQFFPLDEYARLGEHWSPEPPPIRDVPLSDLTATQHAIRDGFLDRPDGGGPVSVWRGEDGRMVIQDGHHRAARAAALGQETVPARVFEPSSPNGSPRPPPDGPKSHRSHKPPPGGIFFSPETLRSG